MSGGVRKVRRHDPASRLQEPARRALAHGLRAAIGTGQAWTDADPLDGDRLEALARQHRVGPLLHAATPPGAPLPQRLRSRLRASYLGTLRKNSVALALGRELLDGFARADVTAAPLKGWALLEGPHAVYADPGLRPMDDLDVMVPREEVAAARHVLEGQGFRLVSGAPEARLAGGHELAFHRPVAGMHVFVELHWAWAGRESLLRSLALPGAAFLELLEPAHRVDAAAATARARAAHALFVAVHAARHAFCRWIWLVDLHRLLAAADERTWQLLAAQAHTLRARRPLWIALEQAHELLGTPVPAGLLEALAPGPLRRRAIRRGLARSQEGPHLAGRMAKLLLGDSWRDVARTALWALAPGRAWWEERRPREPGAVPAGPPAASRSSAA